MKKKCIAIECILMALLAFICRCSLDPESRLNKAIEQYLEHKPDAFQALEIEFLDNIIIEKIKGSNLQSTGTILYRLDENEADIIYPLKRSLSMNGGERVTLIDLNGDNIVLSDGLQFCIFDGNGNHRNNETIGDKKNQVKSLIVIGDDVVYYKNFNLYRYSIINKSSEKLVKESFPPPYEKYYKVQLYVKDNLLYILAGVAGSYYCSIVNYETRSVVLKNLGMSSSKHHADTTTISYIAGSSGNWELIQYTVVTKKKNPIAKFNDIMDIELAVGGYLWENRSGLWAAEYGKDRVRIPFSYQLAGTYKGRVLVRYKDYCYFIDMKKLFIHLNSLKDKAPDLFNDEKTAGPPPVNK
jgi:hypothetical protein